MPDACSSQYDHGTLTANGKCITQTTVYVAYLLWYVFSETSKLVRYVFSATSLNCAEIGYAWRKPEPLNQKKKKKKKQEQRKKGPKGSSLAVELLSLQAPILLADLVNWFQWWWLARNAFQHVSMDTRQRINVKMDKVKKKERTISLVLRC